MRELTGKTAFVTGGASGIGLALGKAFVEAGMKVMLADIETDALTLPSKACRTLGRMYAALAVTLPIRPASSVRPACRMKLSEMSMWFAITLVSAAAAVSTTSR